MNEDEQIALISILDSMLLSLEELGLSKAKFEELEEEISELEGLFGLG